MKESQQSKVLRMLKRNYRHGVANYKFPQANILCYTKRVEELRKAGHNILSERQYIKGRATGVWVYHLIEETK